MRSILWLALVAVLMTPSVLRAQVTVTVDAAANRHPISPLIYGIHFGDTATLNGLNATVNRLGGNGVGRYNYLQDIDNRGSDYFFLSFPYSAPLVAGGQGDSFITTSKAGGAEPYLSMPMVGQVATTNASRDVNFSFPITTCGPQTANGGAAGYANAGNGCVAGADVYPCSSGHPLLPPLPAGCDPTSNSVAATAAFQQGWAQHVKNMFGPASAGGLKFWGLDNEPTIWQNVYWDVHPLPADTAEMRQKMIDYGAMIKGVDPSVQVLGPEEWGWDGFFYSGKDQQLLSRLACNGPDCPDRVAQGGLDYTAYLLDQLRQYDAGGGGRVLDVLSEHFYPQGGEFSNVTTDAMQDLRNRSTRGLWDPNYVNESYINDKVRLIPRMKAWVDTYYPGTKIGLSEYDWGADNHINGATAEADLLGIFGREGLDLALKWNTPVLGTPVAKAFQMYRNYDGAKSTFGEASVSASSTMDADNLSAFAAQRTGDGALTVIVINKQRVGSVAATVNLANYAATGTLETWQLTSTNTITHLTPDVAYSGGTFSRSLGPQSITLFVVHGSVAAATADLSISKTDGLATASPGQNVTYTIVASNAGPAAALGATVTDAPPASLTNPTWTCAGAGGGSCTAGPVNGGINDTVNLPSGGSVTYALTGTVSANPTSLSNTATVTAPGGVTDPNPANNSATDADLLICGGEAVIVPDGRVTADWIGAGAIRWFGASLRIYNSYSLEFKSLTGADPSWTVTVVAGDGGCNEAYAATTRDTSSLDPPGATRISFTATGVETFFRAKLDNNAGPPVAFSYRLSDTTLYSPAWSTNGSYDTFYSFQNTTNAALHGVLSFFLTDGGLEGLIPVTIPPGQTLSTNTAALARTRNRAGTVSLAHDGPPGSIVAEAAIANYSLGPAYVQPVKFQAVREAR